MKKLAFLMLVPTLLLASCKSDPIAKMNKAWKRDFGSELAYEHMYGNYDDAYVFLIDGMLTVVSQIKVANYVFSYPNTFEIFCYKFDTFKTLKDAYESEWISEESVHQINQNHLEYLVNRF